MQFRPAYLLYNNQVHFILSLNFKVAYAQYLLRYMQHYLQFSSVYSGLTIYTRFVSSGAWYGAHSCLLLCNLIWFGRSICKRFHLIIIKPHNLLHYTFSFVVDDTIYTHVKVILRWWIYSDKVNLWIVNFFDVVRFFVDFF